MCLPPLISGTALVVDCAGHAYGCAFLSVGSDAAPENRQPQEVVTERAEVVTKTAEVVNKNTEVVNMISANH